MTQTPVTVDQWKGLNAHQFVDCRWGCSITRKACEAYQSRTERRVIHFNGSSHACSRANAEYIRCLLPDPCPHVISNRDSDRETPGRSLQHATAAARRRAACSHARDLERLVNPDNMLRESRWHRSLVKQ